MLIYFPDIVWTECSKQIRHDRSSILRRKTLAKKTTRRMSNNSEHIRGARITTRVVLSPEISAYNYWQLWFRRCYFRRTHALWIAMFYSNIFDVCFGRSSRNMTNWMSPDIGKFSVRKTEHWAPYVARRAGFINYIENVHYIRVFATRPWPRGMLVSGGGGEYRSRTPTWRLSKYPIESNVRAFDHSW